MTLIDSLEEAVEDGHCNLAFKESGSITQLCKSLFDALSKKLQGSTGIYLAAENYEDGIRIQFDKEYGDGWVVFRQSLHEPYVVFNYESSTYGGGKQIVNFILELLAPFNIDCTPLKQFI